MDCNRHVSRVVGIVPKFSQFFVASSGSVIGGLPATSTSPPLTPDLDLFAVGAFEDDAAPTLFFVFAGGGVVGLGVYRHAGIFERVHRCFKIVGLEAEMEAVDGRVAPR